MAGKQAEPGKRYFTAEEANAMLPLVRSIVRDIVDQSPRFFELRERVAKLGPRDEANPHDPYFEESQQLRDEFEKIQERMVELAEELGNLGIELKDLRTGLIDFPCWREGREVYLCWRLGEAEVEHWHELDAGFAGRQKLKKDTAIV
jgi:hypothetical protein